MSKTERMTKTTAAAYLGLSERGLDGLRDRGLLVPRREFGKPIYLKSDLDAFIKARQAHRLPADLDTSKFDVSHAAQQAQAGARRRDRAFLLKPTTQNCNDRPLVLSEGQYDLLVKLLNLSGEASWDGGDLSPSQARKLLGELGWLEQALTLLRQGRGLNVERRIG